MADKVVHDGHRQRLKDRFLKEGIDNFEDHNILELLLFFGIPRKDTNALAHSLMQEFGSLSGVFEAPFEELCKVKGITQNAAFLISMVPQLSRKYLDDKYKTGQVLNSTEKVGKFLLHKYIGRKDEMVSMICMDNKCRVLNWSIVSEGSVNAAEVSIRKIVQNALTQNSSNVIIAHNHPNGLAIPSSQDIKTTERIKSALAAVGINLLDHIIIADDDFISISDSENANLVTTLG